MTKKRFIVTMKLDKSYKVPARSKSEAIELIINGFQESEDGLAGLIKITARAATPQDKQSQPAGWFWD